MQISAIFGDYYIHLNMNIRDDKNENGFEDVFGAPS